MAKPKILIGLTYYLPNISGVTRYASILAEEFKKRKYEVRIITAKYKKGIQGEEKIERISGFQIGKGFIMPMYWWKSLQLVKWADIVNCHLPAVEAFWLAVWAKWFKKKLVVTYHCRMETGNLILNKVIDLIQNYICSLADVIVVNTQDYIEGNGLLKNHRNKIVEVYPPIKIKGSVRPKKFRKNKVVGYLGRISKEKNIEMLIEAFKNMDVDYSLVLAGPEAAVGEEKYLKEIEQLISSDQRISKIGRVENPGDFFNSIDCLVLPSNNQLESFGMVLAEAIKCGCPAVAFDLPGIRVPIQKTGFGEICRPNDVEDLKDKIMTVLENGRGYYQNKGKNLELFDYTKTINKYEEIFK
jgi:glycosyltransferase involved in cell wall biosynthesis